ncbi:DUF2795 domain-containing protein [Azotobacter vinelandii]|nr:DUF2795 domain-containing protein [Azotobacter vinelandii]WKN21319.1 DUF2795 domain-containing protein [Azotobacter vinelandii]GLK58602.1 hypothetical protein GCM10017624_07590 [Azotobacter vinelandii]SFX37123.1 Protein of unknown function [Azotobacter vinelandii]
MSRGMGGHSPSNISHHLKGIDFPAGRHDLLKQAERNGADEDVLDTLKRMPDERYESMADVMKGYGSVH